MFMIESETLSAVQEKKNILDYLTRKRYNRNQKTLETISFDNQILEDYHIYIFEPSQGLKRPREYRLVSACYT